MFTSFLFQTSARICGRNQITSILNIPNGGIASNTAHLRLVHEPAVKRLLIYPWECPQNIHTIKNWAAIAVRVLSFLKIKTSLKTWYVWQGKIHTCTRTWAERCLGCQGYGFSSKGSFSPCCTFRATLLFLLTFCIYCLIHLLVNFICFCNLCFYCKLPWGKDDL